MQKGTNNNVHEVSSRRGRLNAVMHVEDLERLRGLIKRDPNGYLNEFKDKLRHFDAQLALLNVSPSREWKDFGSLCLFMAGVAACYPKLSAPVPGKLMALLEEHVGVLDASLRRTVVKSLILLRNRDMLPPTTLLPLFFRLFRCHDKQLREIVYAHIVSDIVNLNRGSKQTKLNRQLQNFMFTMLSDSNETAARRSLDVLVELYRRQIWNDSKTVDVISSACFAESPRLLNGALRFFLTVDSEAEGNGTDSDSDGYASSGAEEDDVAAMSVASKHVRRAFANSTKHAKQSRKRKAQQERALSAAKRRVRRSRKLDTSVQFGALQLLTKPQDFADRLFRLLKQTRAAFEVRLMIMNLISRLVACHQLVVLNFYPFMQRYLRPHQEHITYMLALLAQACHEYIDPDTLQPILRTIADNFVSDRSSPEAMAAGINTIREICRRCPYAIEEPLLRDIVLYKRDRDKNVAAAAKSLMHLYRIVNPDMLHKKDRGRPEEYNVQSSMPTEYGQNVAPQRIPGIELLEEGEDEGDYSSGSDRDGDDEKEEEEEEEVAKIPLEATRFLTQEEFRELRRRRLDNAMSGTTGKRIGMNVDEDTISGPRRHVRMTAAERLAHSALGEEDSYGSKKRNKERTSSTNKEKARNQPFMLAKQSYSVKSKQRVATKIKQRKNRAHAIRMRDGGNKRRRKK
jgi:protein SDA1